MLFTYYKIYSCKTSGDYFWPPYMNIAVAILYILKISTEQYTCVRGVTIVICAQGAICYSTHKQQSLWLSFIRSISGAIFLAFFGTTGKIILLIFLHLWKRKEENQYSMPHIFNLWLKNKIKTYKINMSFLQNNIHFLLFCDLSPALIVIGNSFLNFQRIIANDCFLIV